MSSGINLYQALLKPMKKNKNDNSIKQFKEYLLTSPFVLWTLLFLITFLFTATHYPQQSKVSYSYNIGDVAKRDIKAPKNFFVEDKEATRLKKNEVKESVKIVYDFDSDLLNEIFLKIDAAMKAPQKLFNNAMGQDMEPAPTFAIVLDTKGPRSSSLIYKV